MKNITKSLIALFAVFAVSCSDDVENRPVVYPTNAPVLSAPEENNSYVLLAGEASNQAERFVWSPANFFQAVAVTYTVQIDKAGNEFANAQDLGSVTGGNQLSVSVESLNGKVIAAGGEAFVEGQFQVRVKASLNDSEAMYSNAVTIFVTPYVLYPYTDLFLVGNAIDTNMDGVANDSDWNNNANNPALFRDPADEDKYYFTGYFQAGDFKLLEKKGQWQPQWGAASSSTLAVNNGDGSDPSPINVAVSGYYDLTVDLEAMTYSLTPNAAASGAMTYATIGIIGTATPNNWDSDTDMTQSAFNPHLWYIPSQLLKAQQEMKFRADNDWAVNWGGDTSYSGQASSGGPNIPVNILSDGNYNIWFDDITGRYIYIPVN